MADDERDEREEEQSEDEKEISYEGDHARGDQPWAKASSGDKDNM